jgi:hypothetical protein
VPAADPDRKRRVSMSIDGNWEISVDTPMGKQSSSLALTSDGASLSGSASADGDSVPIYEGSVDGDNATWKIDVTKPFELTVAFTVTVSGDELSGKAQAGAFPPAPVTGSRK